jgi:hypothetical protein
MIATGRFSSVKGACSLCVRGCAAPFALLVPSDLEQSTVISGTNQASKQALTFSSTVHRLIELATIG